MYSRHLFIDALYIRFNSWAEFVRCCRRDAVFPMNFWPSVKFKTLWLLQLCAELLKVAVSSPLSLAPCFAGIHYTGWCILKLSTVPFGNPGIKTRASCQVSEHNLYNWTSEDFVVLISKVPIAYWMWAIFSESGAWICKSNETLCWLSRFGFNVAWCSRVLEW